MTDESRGDGAVVGAKMRVSVMGGGHGVHPAPSYAPLMFILTPT